MLKKVSIKKNYKKKRLDVTGLSKLKPRAWVLIFFLVMGRMACHSTQNVLKNKGR
jgi:hypothetical protein